MQAIPLTATPYFRSRIMSKLPRGLRRKHVLRAGTWLRIRVLDGALSLVDDSEHERSLCTKDTSASVAPGVLHHAEGAGRPVRFQLELYRVAPQAREDLARWENEGGSARRC